MLTKLSALFNVNSDNWFEVDFSRWGSKEQDNTTFELLKNAVISHKAVCIMYVNSWGNRSQRKIYPLKMMYRAKEWYIKAYCVDRADFRIFKFNCINEKKAIKLLETFEHKPEKYTEKVNHIFEVLGISLFECYDMTEKLYNEVNEIVSEINNFLNEESSDERKQI